MFSPHSVLEAEYLKSVMDYVTEYTLTSGGIESVLLNPGLARMLGVFAWLVCQGLGTPLLIGLIDFELRGGDPMKRNLMDMVNYCFS